MGLLLTLCLLSFGQGCGGGGVGAVVPPPEWFPFSKSIAPFATDEIVLPPQYGLAKLTLPSGQTEQAVTNQFVVSLRPGFVAADVDGIEEYVARAGGRVVGQVPPTRTLIVEMPTNAAAETALAEVPALSGVLVVHPNGVVVELLDPDVGGLSVDSTNGYGWVDQIEARQAWNVTTGSADVPIGVVERFMFDGMRLFAGRGADVSIVHIREKYFTGPSSDHNHGAAVASLVGDDGRGGDSTLGIAWDNPLLLVGIEPGSGETDFTYDHVLAGIATALEAGARVVNVSIGAGQVGAEHNREFRWRMTPAVVAAADANSLIVFGAGNDGVADDDQYLPDWPWWLDALEPLWFAALTPYWEEHTVIVAAADDSGAIWRGTGEASNTGAVVDLAAPSTNVRVGSLVDDLLEDQPWTVLAEGMTSCAAPLVTGTCALVWSLDTGLTAPQVKEVVTSTATPANWSGLGVAGSGIVNAFQAVRAVAGDGLTVPRVPTHGVAIDGTVGASEWNGAWTSTESFPSGVGDDPISCDVHLMHDGSFLYVALETPVANGFDAKARLRIDGDDSGTLNGSTAWPYVDITTEQGAPSAASLYTNYAALTSESTYSHVAPGPGEAKASAGSSAVSYEFKVPLADLDVSAARRIRLVITVSSGGYDMWFWPVVDAPDSAGGLQPQHPAVWAELELE